jgi:hypothetical protein
MTPATDSPTLGQRARAALAALDSRAQRRVEKLADRMGTRQARLAWDGARGTHRKPLRSIRRALMAEHAARTGKPDSGRQWVRLRKRLQREHMAHVRAVAQERAA